MSVANLLSSQLSIFPATNGTLQVVPNLLMSTSSGTPATVPHFDCGNKVECDITDILIYHDILVGVSKLKQEKANINTGNQNFIFINLNVPEETTWTIRIGNNLKPNIYKIKLSGKTLRFFKPDGVSYKITHDNILKLLLALIHGEMDFCDKCTIPKQEFFVLQENKQADTIYNFGHAWMPTQPDAIAQSTIGTFSDPNLTITTTTNSDGDNLISTEFSTSCGSIVKK